MPARAIALAWAIEVGDAGAGHLELADLVLHREHHARRIELERGGAEVTVEEVVTVLVGGDPLHDLVAGGVVEQLAGVVVGDAGGELLQRDVDEAVGRGLSGSGTSPHSTWCMRARSSATGSSARVTVR